MAADTGETDRVVHEGLHCSWGHALTINETLAYPRNTTICTVIGEMDMAIMAALSGHVTRVTRDRRSYLVIDLSGVISLGLNGLHVLVDALENHDNECRPALVVGTDRQVNLRLKITGLDRFFHLYDDVAEALYTCVVATIVEDRRNTENTNRTVPSDKGFAA